MTGTKEEELGAQMLSMARKEGHRARLPNFQRAGTDVVTDRVRKVTAYLGNHPESRRCDIARACNLTDNELHGALQRMSADKAISSRMLNRQVALYSLKEMEAQS